MRRARIWAMGLVLSLLAACHPLACFHPSELPKDQPLEIAGRDGFPAENLEILIGDKGVPHIYGTSEPDLAYGMGYMHGRDRLFQIITLRAAALGRLTEIFGEDLLSTDQELRLISYRIDELVDTIAPRSRGIIEAYCAGLNAAAKQVGRSAEMQLLGLDFEAMTPRDVLAIARLQAWDLATGMAEELVRARIANRLSPTDPRFGALTAAAPSGGRPVVLPEEHSGESGFAATKQATSSSPRPASHQPPKPKAPRHKYSERAKEIRRGLGLDGRKGASNVWAVDGAHTAHGHAVVAHDPHLAHRGPGVFYLVHLESPEFTIAGASFPGLPAILIGQGDHIAWGIPVSNADSQDLVRIAPYQGRDELYLLDGVPHGYGTLRQTYRLGTGEDAPIFEEVWKTTAFGPVLPPGYDDDVDEGDVFALMWTGFDPFGTSGDIIASFWAFARSQNIDEATEALQLFTAPPMSLGMAFTDGTIAYRLSGDIPLRKSDEPTNFPRNGTSRAAGWEGRLPPSFKPELTNPSKGYLVAANQRVVDSDGPQAQIIGYEGATPFRARRIHERLEALLAEGHLATTEEIFAIQQDVESIEARELSVALAAGCPRAVEGHPDDRVQGFCQALTDFDAQFSVESLGALPFTWLWDEVKTQMLIAHFGDDVARAIRGPSFVQMALHQAIVEEHAGSLSPLLDDPSTATREGIAGFVARATPKVLDALVARAGGSPSDWRWGKLHTLSVRSPLASAPLIGFLFDTSPREEAGCTPCVRSERNTPVTSGAVLRNIGEMDPAGPIVRTIIDSGNSGHYGHRHLEDQAPLWSRGEPLRLALPRSEVEDAREGWLKIKPE